MKKLWSIGMLLAGAAGMTPAQTHKVPKPETVVRAVGVYEWTGDLAKPAASRLIPVTLYIDKKLEDAGLYLARPVPFALGSGNIYELDQAGVARGNLELVYARHLQAANVAESYDDGWFGYGSFKGLAAPKKPVTRHLPAARTAGIETTSTASDPDKPHFSNKAGQPVTPASGSSTGSDTTKADANTADTTASKNTSTATPADDPDRPTMKRRTGNDTADTSTTTATPTTSTPATTTTSSADAPADDPDRPTLKRHSVEDAKKKAKDDAQASVTPAGSLNDDPDRPNLHRGKPTSALTEQELPRLSGLPVELKQMVAVSDAANRPAHDFGRPWEDDAERAAILTKMQGIAQAQLAAYTTPLAPTAKTSAPASIPGRPNSKLRRPVKPLKQAPALLDEQLNGYLLSYGDVPTFVYQAHTTGEGETLRYVTIVAQLDAQHEPKMVLQAVTDAAHLDRTARMRLVDAVDVEASNRASLLFEMRGQTSRQFGLYRILGLQAEQIFSTGTMQ